MSSRARIRSSRSMVPGREGLSVLMGRRGLRRTLSFVTGSGPRRGGFLLGNRRRSWRHFSERWVDKLRPRDEAELDLVTDVVHARWSLIRAASPFFTFENTYRAGRRPRGGSASKMYEQTPVDRRGPLCMYALSSCNDGEPGTSWQESPDDPNDPAALVRELEGSAKGCEALIRNWRLIAERVSNDLPVQAHDRLTATRLLGRQPVDVGRDERVNLIFLASFALHPIGRVDAYEDLKSDMGTVELEKFRERIRNRGPLILTTWDTPRVKQTLLDLVDRVVQRLTGKLEVYQQLASENEADTAARLAHDHSQDAERMRRYEQAAQRRVHRCEDAFWKHRRECEQREGQEADYLHENLTDSSDDSEVAEEATIALNKKLPSEPNVAISASEVGTEKEVAALDKQLEWANAAVSAMRAGGIDPFATRVAGSGAGRAAIEAAIVARGPLLRPIT